MSRHAIPPPRVEAEVRLVVVRHTRRPPVRGSEGVGDVACAPSPGEHQRLQVEPAVDREAWSLFQDSRDQFLEVEERRSGPVPLEEAKVEEVGVDLDGNGGVAEVKMKAQTRGQASARSPGGAELSLVVA